MLHEHGLLMNQNDDTRLDFPFLVFYARLLSHTILNYLLRKSITSFSRYEVSDCEYTDLRNSFFNVL